MESCFDDIKLERLNENDNLSSFFCGEKDIDNCIHGSFFEEVNTYNANAFKLTGDNELIAIFAIGKYFLSLDADEIEYSNMLLPEGSKLDENLNQLEVESMEIFFLAVNENLRYKGYGSSCLETILDMTRTNFPRIRFLSLDSHKKAVDFYLKNDFVKAEKDDPTAPTLRMYKVIDE